MNSATRVALKPEPAQEPRPLTILAVDDFVDVGGAQLMLLRLLAGLDSTRYRPQVVLPREGRLAELYRAHSIPCWFVDLAKLKQTYTRVGPAVKAVFDLHNVIQQSNADIVHANSLWTMQFLALAARLTRRPLVTSIHAFPIIHSPLKRMIFSVIKRLTVRQVQKTIVVSRALAAAVLNANIVRPKDLEIIANGIDLKRYRSPVVEQTWRATNRLPESCFLIGTVGRIHPGKGQELFLEAAVKVLSHTSTAVHFVVIGQEFRTELENLGFSRRLAAQAQRLGIADCFHIIGFQEDMISAYAALDIVALPTYEETFGMVVLEAMAMGKPVIASATGGIPELVTDGLTGLLVKVGDYNGLAQSMLKLVNDPDYGAALGAAARNHALTHYDLQASIRSLARVYGLVSGRDEAVEGAHGKY